MPVMHRIEYALFKIVTGILSLLPERVGVMVGAATGWFAGSVLRLRRAAVDKHLALAFPDESPQWRARVARRSYVHLGREAVTIFRLAREGRESVAARTRMIGFEAVREAAARGGVIAITGHLGNWEIAGAAVAAHGVPIDAVTKGMANQRFGEELERAREGLGMTTVDMMDASKVVLRNLRRGGRLQALLADQSAHRGGVFVPFFGRLAATVRGPALFALRSGCPVFLATAIRGPGWAQRYTVTFKPIPVPATGDAEADTFALTLAHTQALEDAIRSAPEQYFWMHRRWKKRPPEEGAS